MRTPLGFGVTDRSIIARAIFMIDSYAFNIVPKSLIYPRRCSCVVQSSTPEDVSLECWSNRTLRDTLFYIFTQRWSGHSRDRKSRFEWSVLVFRSELNASVNSRTFALSARAFSLRRPRVVMWSALLCSRAGTARTPIDLLSGSMMIG